MERLQRISSLLACPHCGGILSLQDNELVSQSCGRRYPVRDGVPILLPSEMVNQGLGGMLDADEHASIHPYSPASEDLIRERADGWVLDLGAGGKHIQYSNVVQVDVFRFPMTDVVASADCLPFRNDAFDAVVSQAVFEHLQYPDAAAKEIWRVLKPDGVAKVDTAFLQPEHAYPHHYFNATETGLKHWFRDFDIEWSGVEPYQHPAWALLWFLDVYMAALPDAQKALLGDQTLNRCIAVLKAIARDEFFPEDKEVMLAFDSLSPSSKKKLAAGVSVRAIKRAVPHIEQTRADAKVVSALPLELERRIDNLTGQIRWYEEREKVRHEHDQVRADVARYLLHEVDAKTLKPTRIWAGIASGAARYALPVAWLVSLRKLYRRAKGLGGSPCSNDAPDIVFWVKPTTFAALLGQFFSLVHQTHANWLYVIVVPARCSTMLKHLMSDLCLLDNRVSLVFVERQVASVSGRARVWLLPDTMLDFSAVKELTTLHRHRPELRNITADTERWQPGGAPLHCWGQLPQPMTVGSELPHVMVIGGAEEPPIACKTALNAHIPKALYRQVHFSTV